MIKITVRSPLANILLISNDVKTYETEVSYSLGMSVKDAILLLSQHAPRFGRLIAEKGLDEVLRTVLITVDSKLCENIIISETTLLDNAVIELFLPYMGG